MLNVIVTKVIKYYPKTDIHNKEIENILNKVGMGSFAKRINGYLVH